MASCRPRAGTVVRLSAASAGGAARAGAAASPRRSPTAGGVRPSFAEPPPILHIPSGPIAHSALVPKGRRQACDRGELGLRGGGTRRRRRSLLGRVDERD